jgi:peroxiredoxin Q/BCP
MRNAALWLVCAALPIAAQGLSGRRAPSFSLPDSKLQQHDILDYRGKWLLLDFMKTDCPFCQALSKNMEDIRRRFEGKVAVLAVVVSPPENMNTVGKYMADNKLTNPIAFDMGQVAIAYFRATPERPTFDTPHLFLIDPNGQIVRDWAQSAQTKDILEGGGLAAVLEVLLSARK